MEVIAAVVILAVVATATISSLVALRGKSAEKLDQQNIADLQGKCNTYYMEFGKWPDSKLKDLSTNGYTDSASYPTPFGGDYTFDTTTLKVVNTNAP